MKSFLLALQFLTITPVKITRIAERDLPRAAAYFPLAGMLIGAALAGANILISFAHLDPIVSNIILVVLLAVLTGGLHLDGLSDTFDAFSGGKDRQGMLEIMRDPRVGTMGVLALVLVLMLKVALLSSIDPPAIGRSLVLVCVLSRWSMVLSLFAFPYARTEGKAKVFIDGLDKKLFAAATLSALGIAIIAAGMAGAIIFVIAAIFAYTVGTFIKKKLGGITGDTVGAVNELTEVAVLFSIAILGRL